MKWVKLSQVLLFPLTLWVLCLRLQIEKWDSFSNISESNHTYYFPSSESPAEPWKTRILLCDEYTIYIKGYIHVYIYQWDRIVCLLFPLFFWPCTCCLETWNNSSYQGFTLSIFFFCQFLLYFIWKHFRTPFYIYLFVFGQLLEVHMTFDIWKERVKSLRYSALLFFPFFLLFKVSISNFHIASNLAG